MALPSLQTVDVRRSNQAEEYTLGIGGPGVRGCLRHCLGSAVVVGSFRASQIYQQQRRIWFPPISTDHQAHDCVRSTAVLVFVICPHRLAFHAPCHKLSSIRLCANTAMVQRYD